MKRDAITKLEKWKNNPRRKPLILNGARQVGKTWLLQEFGKQHFENIAYVNLDSSASACGIFDLDFDISRILTALQAQTHVKIQPQKTLIIFDEIQECPKALTSLKYFCENARDYAVCAAGSLLGVTVHSGTGYPAGKVNNLDLYPLTFFEFLDAVGEGGLRELMENIASKTKAKNTATTSVAANTPISASVNPTLSASPNPTTTSNTATTSVAANTPISTSVNPILSASPNPTTTSNTATTSVAASAATSVSANFYAALAPFHDKLKDLVRTYYFTGGMPEAVQTFVDTGSLDDVREVQLDILLSYERDISKHLTHRETEYCLGAFHSIPGHLGQENKKFIFSNIAPSARASNYRFAITWLEQAGIALRVPRVSKPGVPLSAYADSQAFKLFMLDVGLLGALSGIDSASVIEGNRIFVEFKGALAEQYVCQQLVANGLSPFYWSAKNSTGEVDFLVQRNTQVYPIEVKAEENLRAKSLRAFSTKFDNEKCRRFSLSPYRDQDWMINIPLYAICALGVWS